MARVKICQTQATQSDRSLDIMDSGGKSERSIRTTSAFLFPAAFLGATFLDTAFLGATFLDTAFLGTTFLAARFFTGFAARFFFRVAMFHCLPELEPAVC